MSRLKNVNKFRKMKMGKKGSTVRIKKYDNLFIFNVDEPVIRDVLIAQWLGWWDAADEIIRYEELPRMLDILKEGA